jgi:chemotaxis protein methyltransferase CheR
MRSLGLDDVEAYRDRLQTDTAEWAILDGMTRITISRFFRDRDVFEYLCATGLPMLHRLSAPGRVQIWSAGCAGGEEPYSLAIGAHQQGIAVQITATDADEQQLERAERAVYSQGSLKDLPPAWRELAFEDCGAGLRLKNQFRANVELLLQDLRQQMPDGRFHLLLCRNLAFTYFEPQLQRRIARQLLERTLPRGLIVLGKHESWPDGVPGVSEVDPGLRVYQKNE